VSGATREDEMCNAYMMVYSEMPYYMVCGNERAMVRTADPSPHGGQPYIIYVHYACCLQHDVLKR